MSALAYSVAQVKMNKNSKNTGQIEIRPINAVRCLTRLYSDIGLLMSHKSVIVSTRRLL